MNKNSNTNVNNVGKNIRKLRYGNGERLKDLGKEVGLGDTAIANYEKGIRQPDLNTLMKIAKHYGVTIDELLNK